MITINVPEPKWNIELRDYQHEDTFLAKSFKVTLFEPIFLRSKRNDCIINFWIISNRCAKRCKFDETGVLTFDLNCSS